MKTLRKLRDFPEIQAAERAAIINPSLSAASAANDPILVAAGTAVFGVSSTGVTEWLFEASDLLDLRERDGDVPTWGEVDDAVADRRARFMKLYGDEDPPEFDDIASHDAYILAKFASHGWDATNDQGRVLLVAQNLLFPFLAAVHGCAGAKLPEEGIENLAAWTQKLAAPSPKPKPISRGPAPAPISEEERRRRNMEAKRSTVWRPEPRKT